MRLILVNTVLVVCSIVINGGCSQQKNSDEKAMATADNVSNSTKNKRFLCPQRIIVGSGLDLVKLGQDVGSLKANSRVVLNETGNPLQLEVNEQLIVSHNIYDEITAIQIPMEKVLPDCFEVGTTSLNSKMTISELKETFAPCVELKEQWLGCRPSFCQNKLVEIRECAKEGKVVGTLILHIDPTKLPAGGREKTNLMYFVEKDDITKVDLMLRRQFRIVEDVNIYDEFGQNVLMKIILSKGPRISRDKMRLVKIVAPHVQDLSVKDFKGKTAISMANQQGLSDITNYLKRLSTAE